MSFLLKTSLKPALNFLQFPLNLRIRLFLSHSNLFCELLKFLLNILIEFDFLFVKRGLDFGKGFLAGEFVKKLFLLFQN